MEYLNNVSARLREFLTQNSSLKLLDEFEEQYSHCNSDDEKANYLLYTFNQIKKTNEELYLSIDEDHNELRKFFRKNKFNYDKSLSFIKKNKFEDWYAVTLGLIIGLSFLIAGIFRLINNKITIGMSEWTRLPVMNSGLDFIFYALVFLTISYFIYKSKRK